MSTSSGFEDRSIVLGNGLIPVPERLLLAHARGEVLFITGAGSSRPAGLPDFRNLVLQIYQKLDGAAHAVLKTVPAGAHNQWKPSDASLTTEQSAEVGRFVRGDYDVVLGMLERRLDGPGSSTSRVRRSVVEAIGTKTAKPAEIHKALVRLADRKSPYQVGKIILQKAREIACEFFDLFIAHLYGDTFVLPPFPTTKSNIVSDSRPKRVDHACAFARRQYDALRFQLLGYQLAKHLIRRVAKLFLQ